MRYWFGDGLESEEVASASNKSESGTSESFGGPNRRRGAQAGSYTTDSTGKPLGDRPYSFLS